MKKMTAKEVIEKLTEDNGLSILNDCVQITFYCGYKDSARKIGTHYMLSTIGEYLLSKDAKRYYFKLQPMDEHMSAEIDIVIERAELSA